MKQAGRQSNHSTHHPARYQRPTDRLISQARRIRRAARHHEHTPTAWGQMLHHELYPGEGNVGRPGVAVWPVARNPRVLHCPGWRAERGVGQHHVVLARDFPGVLQPIPWPGPKIYAHAVCRGPEPGYAPGVLSHRPSAQDFANTARVPWLWPLVVADMDRNSMLLASSRWKG